MSQKFTLNVNGQTHTIDADPDMPLLYALRNGMSGSASMVWVWPLTLRVNFWLMACRSLGWGP